MPYALILLTSIICKLATEIVIFIMHIWRPATEGQGLRASYHHRRRAQTLYVVTP